MARVEYAMHKGNKFILRQWDIILTEKDWNKK